ncbi:hypothetical protein ABZ802_31380 [Streptomyces sp. NPDC047737]|uniref:hypothetical protein n=1 Tax=Streptomyces sp. NPDC047737 TaxID=3155740 RepID=UPI0033C2A2E0
MRRPALHHPNRAAASAWARPYSTGVFSAVFYASGDLVDPVVPAANDPADPPKPTPPAQRTFTQAEVEALAAKEKAQGKRSAAKEFAEKHGFTTIEDAEAFIAAARQSQEAALSEQEKRERELSEREAKAEAREKAAEARERTANRRAVLVGLGATGVDLDDAAALLRVADDADDTDVQESAEALKQRRPELFGATRVPDPAAVPPAPTGLPAAGVPRPGANQLKPGERGLAMLKRRGKIPADAN